MTPTTNKGKIIITGPGRSGTTFLVQLLTRLGYDTGFEPYNEPVAKEMRAGCEVQTQWFGLPIKEKRANMEKAPRILKAPEWSMALKECLFEEVYPIDHVIIPIRDLRIAAQSRLDAGCHYMTIGTVDDQESVHALMLGKCIEACYLYDIPYTLMKFPRLVADAPYCYRCLNEVFGWDNYEQDVQEFYDKFNELSDVDSIKWAKIKESDK